MMRKRHLFIASTALFFALLVQVNFTNAQSFNKAKGLLKGVPTSFTSDEAAKALKQALEIGISKGSEILSKQDGYYKNPSVKILFPPEAEIIEQKLRAAGLGNQVDKTIESFNRAAEDAASASKDIFIKAIKELTVTDAINIVKGADDAATMYLKEKVEGDLIIAFTPVIENSLSKVNATKYWEDLINTYNKIPFVKKQNPDLTAYVTQKAIDGLFTMVAEQELNIRKSASARTSDLLKKVFK